jgi:hypothetical protein
MRTPLSFKLVLTGDVDETCVVSRLKPITIGREGDVKVRDPKASRLNCRIELTDNGLEVHDLRSLNGTLLNGERIKRTGLKSGDVLRIGDAVIRVKVEEAKAAVTQGLKATIARASFKPEDSGQISLAPGVDRGLAKVLEGEGFSQLERLREEPPTWMFHGVRTVLQQPVTVRVLDAGQAQVKESERFLNEAKVAARLSHPHIVRLLDARMAAKLIYMLLERLPARTLKDEIDPEQPMSAERTLALALPVARALVYAHGLGVTHGNLRPDLIWIGGGDRDEDVKVMGFSRLRPKEGDRAVDTQSASSSSANLGGEESDDIHGFGALLYHCVTGRSPVDATGALGEAPPVIDLRPDLPPRLVKLITRCLKTAPQERFAGARELHHTLEAAIREAFGFQQGSANVNLLLRYSKPSGGAGAAPAENLEDTVDGVPAPAAPDAPAEEGAGGEAIQGSLPTFLGSFAENELIELVQMVEVNQKSGLLDVTAEGGAAGRIAFDQGTAVRARYQDKSGKDALMALLSLSGGRFRLTVGAPLEGEVEHRLPIGPLLLEIMRMRDEAHFEE